MTKVIGYSLLFVGGVMLNVAGGLNVTDWQWWAIAVPMILGSSLT